MGPPNPGLSLQLMGRIFCLLVLGDPQQTKFLLNSFEPLIRLERFLGHLEDRRLGIQKILEGAVLVWLRPLLLWVGASRVLRNEAQGFLHSPLTSQELGKELISRWWWWRWW